MYLVLVHIIRTTLLRLIFIFSRGRNSFRFRVCYCVKGEKMNIFLMVATCFVAVGRSQESGENGAATVRTTCGQVEGEVGRSNVGDNKSYFR